MTGGRGGRGSVSIQMVGQSVGRVQMDRWMRREETFLVWDSTTEMSLKPK